MIKKRASYYSLISLVIGMTSINACSVTPTSPAKIDNKNNGNTSSSISKGNVINPTTNNPNTTSTSNLGKRPLINTPTNSTSTNSGNYSSLPLPSSQSTYINVPAATASTTPSGSTGGNDIKELATFNGRIYDKNGVTVDDATVSAVSAEPGVTYVAQEQKTSGGSYVFRNAPVGTRILVTVTKNGFSKQQTVVLKSNLTGDPGANTLNFGTDNTLTSNGGTNGSVRYAIDSPELIQGQTRISGKVYDINGNLIDGATVSAESVNSSINWTSSIQMTSQGNYSFDNVPAGIKIKITVITKDGKTKTREQSVTNQENIINFGGNDLNDKTFAISSTKDNFFVDYGVNPFVDTLNDHLSTFSIDVDTASYTWMRKSIIEQNAIPDKKSVRVEEYINYFDYNYLLPTKDSFNINTEIANSPIGNENKKILRIGLQGKDLNDQKRKDAVLTFVVDVSGSMNLDTRLGLVKQSLELLIKQLKKDDKVGIVIFGSEARVLLEPKSVINESEILNAIRSLQTEGSTNTEAGLLQGFKLAQKYYKAGASNRVILCSDGVANVGETGPDVILQKIKEVNESGISLSTIGFGMGNYNDTLMEQLANKGDGYYAYVDNIKEAYRVFVENLNGSLQTIAKDVKIQVDFNPDTVRQYRLLGYENRDIKDQDFRNDKVDAGEVGINTSVTALYEVELRNNSDMDKIADISIRYKDSDDLNRVKEFTKVISTREINSNFSSSSYSFKLATSVALFAEILRHSYWGKDGSLSDVLRIARESKNGYDNTQKIDEFISIVDKASRLQNNLD